MKFWFPWGIDVVVAAIAVFFFLWGLADGSVSSFNIGLWVVILGALAALVGASLWLKSNGRPRAATVLAWVLAAPGLLVGLFSCCSSSSIRAGIDMRVIAFFLSIAACAHAFAQPAADAAAVEATVRGFHEALASGDANGALRLLAADAVILESGERETRDEYAAHHLAADIEFARAVPMRRGPLQVSIGGNTAWVASTGRLQGTFQARAIDVATAELMVLSRTASGWEIRAIHWSSR